MSRFTYGCPYRSPTSTSTATQGPESAAPHLDINAPPFAQANRQHHQEITHGQSPHVSRYPQYMHYAPIQETQIRPALPNQYGPEHIRLEYQTFFPDDACVYPPSLAQAPAEPPIPRRGTFCPDPPPDAFPIVTWRPMPNQSTMGEAPGWVPPLTGLSWTGPSWREDSVMSNSGFTGFPQQNYVPSAQVPPTARTGGYDQATSPVRASPPLQAYTTARRSAQHGPYQYNNSVHRPLTGRPLRYPTTQSRSPIGDDAPRAMLSPNGEEANVRGPSSHRHRRLPRDARMRYSGGSAQYNDPNIVTSRQIQELKDKLPRRLPCELPEGTSNTCDICAKDYSNTCVPPCAEDEVAIELSCGHCFGEFCIFEWVCITFLALCLRMQNYSNPLSLTRVRNTKTRLRVQCAGRILSNPLGSIRRCS
jgi:hypothetical protein